ncbi:myoneurin-like isoform X7 [Anopheles aquasalis]|uniref:myoneurin-like isoform X6 n=1 Tax=Anopheles aquasalis TaxID=42839 RepID=UPI00215A5072|nr:myoneurin-like isoform X6 [Anopheles aquasalis]XP_050093395.1 myoneurin-like isoform X7 [Anopheles aquasalis]
MLTKYCRICLTSVGVVHQLDEVVHKSLSLYEMLCKMYPEAFTENNDAQWPTKACDICKQAILDAYGLYVVCMSTLDILRKRLKSKPHESNQSSAEMSFSDQSFIVAENETIDFNDHVKNTSDAEDNTSSLSIEEEELIRVSEERIAEEEQNNARLLFSTQQEQCGEGKDIILQSQNEEAIEIKNEAAGYYSHEIVELSVEMDCVAPNNIIPIEEEHLDEFEGSMEYLDDTEDSLHARPHQEYEDHQRENAVNQSAVTVTVSSDSSEEGENVFTEIFSSQIFSCESCRDVFLDIKTLEKHLKYHRAGFHIFCKMCNKGFKHATALHVHECAFDSSTLCWICGEKLDSQGKHKRHMQSHMPEGTWACQFCPLRFSTQTAMNSHEYIHKKDRRHCCDICGANLSSKRNLNYHQRAVHGGGLEKLLPCNICGRRFAIPSVLKRHMNSHTGLRPYSCVYCNRVYGSCGDLVEHVAKHHVGNENIYLCHLCDADFPKIRELRDHYEVHSRKGEKFYNEILTDFGKFRFTTMDLLKMRHHKETVKSASIV